MDGLGPLCDPDGNDLASSYQQLPLSDKTSMEQSNITLKRYVSEIVTTFNRNPRDHRLSTGSEPGSKPDTNAADLPESPHSYGPHPFDFCSPMEDRFARYSHDSGYADTSYEPMPIKLLLESELPSEQLNSSRNLNHGRDLEQHKPLKHPPYSCPIKSCQREFDEQRHITLHLRDHISDLATKMAKEREKLTSTYESIRINSKVRSRASMEKYRTGQRPTTVENEIQSTATLTRSLGSYSSSAEPREGGLKLEPNSVQANSDGHQTTTSVNQRLSERLEAAILARKLVTVPQDQGHNSHIGEDSVTKCGQKKSRHACERDEDSETMESTASKSIMDPTNDDILQQPWDDSSPSEVTRVESPNEDFLELMFLENDDGLSSLESLIVSQAASDTSSSRNIPRRVSTDSPNTTLESSSSRKGKGKEIGRGEDLDHLNRGNKRPRLALDKRPGMKVQQGRRLACPLHIFNQQKYCKNAITRKKYETCSGPGWPNMRYLEQHLGNSASAVHKKMRCPRCLSPFKTAKDIVKHQESNPLECQETQTLYEEDDINREVWNEIENNVSRNAFNQLSQSLREEIDTWVCASLHAYAPQDPLETRKTELRKWNIVWRTLFPGSAIPAHPFYDDNPSIPVTKSELLVNEFKRAVELRTEEGDIEGVDGETLVKLQECLRLAISNMNINYSTEPPPVKRNVDSSQGPIVSESPSILQPASDTQTLTVPIAPHSISQPSPREPLIYDLSRNNTTPDTAKLPTSSNVISNNLYPSNDSSSRDQVVASSSRQSSSIYQPIFLEDYQSFLPPLNAMDFGSWLSYNATSATAETGSMIDFGPGPQRPPQTQELGVDDCAFSITVGNLEKPMGTNVELMSRDLADISSGDDLNKWWADNLGVDHENLNDYLF